VACTGDFCGPLEPGVIQERDCEVGGHFHLSGVLEDLRAVVRDELILGDAGEQEEREKGDNKTFHGLFLRRCGQFVVS